MTRARDDGVTIRGYHLGETEKAVKFSIREINGNLQEPLQTWFPLSQIKSITRASPETLDELDTLVVSTWICQQKELV